MAKLGTLSVLTGLLVAVIAMPPAVLAVTPAQTAAAELKAKADAATRQKAANDSRARSEAASKAQTASAVRAKTKAIGNLSTHNEIKRRLEATRSAAAIHARVLAASTVAGGGPQARHTDGTPKRRVPAHPATAALKNSGAVAGK